ncbi:hypothetical protein MKX08_010520 [Trichoderma sp. CBMAI-0020]|nr:hypothetical protein MKX08_010520 [Trichoderma sp. CBMAI-0020]
MAPARQQPPPPFNKDEKVLCFHMDMLYEAKIMDVQPAEKPNEGYRYKVHYKGWKNTWDDWVLVDRIRPFDDEHKELAAQLHAQLKTSMQKTAKVPKKVVKSGGESARGSEERSSAVTQGGRGGRRGKDWDLEQPKKIRIKLNVKRPREKIIIKRKPPVEEPLVEEPLVKEPLAEISDDKPRAKIIIKRKPPVEEPLVEISGNKPPIKIIFKKKPAVEEPLAKEPLVEISGDKRPIKIIFKRKPPVEEPPVEEPLAEISDNKPPTKIIIKRKRPVEEPLVEEPLVKKPLIKKPLVKEPLDEKPLAEIRIKREPPTETPLAEISGNKPPTKEDAFHSKPMINISVPDHVQAMLVDDWENITKNNQLVPLPHPKPVSKIFEDYLAVERPRREEGSSSMDILEEVIAGFREYFEKALSRILLYRFERHQYMDVRKLWDNAENSQYKNVCDVYGAEHLARLIVSLPELLAQTNMDQQSVSRLREEIGKFTSWLGRNCETYFVNEYETPSQEYIDKARSF